MNNFYIKVISIFTVLGILSGCASKPEDIKTQYVSPMLYKDYDCEQLAVEKNRIDREIGILYESLKNRANKDTAQAVGAVFFWPFLFALEGGDGPEAIEYGRLRGQAKAIQEVSIRKKCGLDFSKYRFK